MKNIKFYIVVPVYKAERFIQQCLNSILNQTYQELEVVLVDDGSPDQSGAICDAMAQRDRRVHVIHKKNEGQISARSAGIAFAKRNCCEENSFFVFVDSDDYLEPDALDILANVIREQNCDCVIYGMQRVCDGKILDKTSEVAYVGSVLSKRELYKTVFYDMAYNSLCRKAVSCSLVSDDDWSEFYHIRHGEDLLQSIPIYKNCKNPYFINDVLYNYRMNPDSITHSGSLSSFVVDSTVRRTVWEFLQEENVLTEQDIAEYLDRCRFFLRTKVRNICEIPGKYAEYRAKMEMIRNDPYYAMLLNHGHKDWVLSWLKEEKYNRIIAYAKLRSFLGKLYRFARMILQNVKNGKS